MGIELNLDTRELYFAILGKPCSKKLGITSGFLLGFVKDVLLEVVKAILRYK